MNSNVNQLIESKEKFHSYVVNYFNHPKFSGPSVYFHEKTLKMIHNTENFSELITSTEFVESCYATLTSWGMHKMGPTGPKLKNFENFLEAIQFNKKRLLELKPYRLNKITETDVKLILPQLDLLFQNINIMNSEIKFVGNSKLLHHILPDLIPPMDREYTLQFFYDSKMVNSANERKKFAEIFLSYWYICKKLDLQDDDYLRYPRFTTSIPKLIDNAIIGFLMGNSKTE